MILLKIFRLIMSIKCDSDRFTIKKKTVSVITILSVMKDRQILYLCEWGDYGKCSSSGQMAVGGQGVGWRRPSTFFKDHTALISAAPYTPHFWTLIPLIFRPIYPLIFIRSEFFLMFFL